jgi:putative transposase
MAESHTFRSLIKTLFKKKKYGRRLAYKPDDILTGILRVVVDGCQWRSIDRPEAPWRVCYYHFRRIISGDLWQTSLDHLRQEWRRLHKNCARGHIGLIDSQSVRISKTASARGFDGGKKVWGRKRHLLVDCEGLLIQVKVTPANVFDGRIGARMVFEAKCKGLCRLTEVHADGAYRGMKWPRGTKVVIGRNPCSSTFQPIKHRWKVERSIAWLGGYRRLSKDYEGLFKTSEAFVHIAFIHLICKRLDKAQSS